MTINCVPARLVEGDLATLARAAAPVFPSAPTATRRPVPAGMRSGERVEPEDYARWPRDWLAMGARIVGGCCGTGPAHTAKLRAHARQVHRVGRHEMNIASPNE